MRKKQSETETNKQMVEYLLKIGCYCWRNNTGCMKSGGRFVHFGHAGSGDIIGFTRTGRFISVENKSNGEPISDAQKEFSREVISRGGIALFVTSLDDLISQFSTIAACNIADDAGL